MENNKLKYLFLVVSFLFIFSCNKQSRVPKFETPAYEIMADKLTKKTARKLEEQKNLHLIGIGGGMMNQIRMMSMSFVYKNEINIESGRDLLISCVDEYLAAVNSDTELRSYLVNYPFEPRNVEIWIYIHNPDNSLVGEGKISFISSINGVLGYRINNGSDSKTIHTETYEEALQKLGSKEAAKQAGAAEREDVVWEDLRIQKLLPEYMVFPAIEPCLPKNFVGLCDPRGGRASHVYWGEKEAVEGLFSPEAGYPKSAVIRASISADVAQKDENVFSIDEKTLRKDLASLGARDIVVNQWKWGNHPVLSCDARLGMGEVRCAWIGLNYASQALHLCLYNPNPQNAPTEEGTQLWFDFIKKTQPLSEYETIKSTGQDLRDGFTLVNVYGSIVKVSAEKKDNKIEAIIESDDKAVSCQLVGASYGTMGLSWRRNDPLMRIEAIFTNPGGDVTIRKTVSVLLKEVPEFSFNQADFTTTAVTNSGIFAILNRCK